MHAANVIDALVRHASTTSSSELQFFGMGGRRLAESGMEVLVNVDNHAVMGLLEVLHKYPALRANLGTLRKALSERKPDVLLLVDYPHFNMKLAATARSLGIPVVYFIAPKVWASRPGRLAELSKLVDHIALILPFEKKIFDAADIPCTYVGNPLLDNPKLKKAAKNSHSKDHKVKRIALLPGSRKSEVSMLLPPMLQTCVELSSSQTTSDQPKGTPDDWEFLLPVAETIDRDYIQKIASEYQLNLTLIQSDDYDELASCDVALVASGTATLELAILGVPMVVIYKLKPLSYKVLKRWLTIEHISLVNIIAEKRVVPELLQDEVTAEKLSIALSELLTDSDARQQQLTQLEAVYKELGSAGASDKTAKLLRSIVSKSKSNNDSDLKDLACT